MNGIRSLLPAHVVSAFGNDIALVGRIDLDDGGSVFQVATDGLDLVFLFKLDVELEDLVALLGLNLLSVDEEGDFLLVGIDLDEASVLTAVDISLGTDMDEWFVAPICLADIEGILPCLSVEGDKTFVAYTAMSPLSN